ncbi:MAG: terminase small subunit [Methylococcaceae bacterium]
MATKPKTDWAKLRAEWESSNQEGYVWLATKYGVDKSNLSRKIKSEGWLKNTTITTNETTRNDAVLIEIEAVEIQPATTEIQLSKMGRPTKYKPEYCQQIINHFSNNEAYVVLNNDDDDTKRKAFLNRPITMYGFAQKIGVDVDTVANWANARDENGRLENPDFFSAYKAAMTMQAAMILEGSMAGVYNPNISALILKNNHGYRDVQVNETEVYISKDTEENLNKLYELRVGSINETQAVIEGRFERITRGTE